METRPQDRASAPPVAAEHRDANPVLVRVVRGGAVESQHRGAFAVCDPDGSVAAAAGDVHTPVFARSSIKALQALPLVESGAADHFGFTPEELALAISSHDAEAQHTERVAALLGRLQLSVDDLRCGPQPPTDAEARRRLAERRERPSALHNNCSGKHTGFLALARHLSADPRHYLDPDAPVQEAVRRAVGEVCGLAPAALEHAIDGCSAPTFRLPLAALARAFARLAAPDSLPAPRGAAARRLLDAAAMHPALVAGEHKRLDTALLRATGGRLFPKIGAEAVYVIAARDRGQGLALKVDDGGWRGLFPLVVGLCRELGWLDRAEVEQLAEYAPGPYRNWAGLEVGHIDVDVPATAARPPAASRRA
jgi:L-asparaginase II